MRILLVVPRFVARHGDYYVFPLGIATISACLKAAGEDVHCLNLNHCETDYRQTLYTTLKRLQPAVVGTGGLSVHYQQVREIVEATRQALPAAKIMIGGGIVSSEPELMLASLGADIGIIGEGEESVVAAVRTLAADASMEKIDGIVLRGSGGCVAKTPARPAIVDLDALPWPDYEGFGMDRHLAHQMTFDHHLFFLTDRPRGIEIVASRSYPYNCFCYHPLGRKYRERSLDSFFSELDYLVDRYGINCLAVMDELFAVKNQRLEEFCRRIGNYHVHWMAQLRVDSVDASILEMMRSGGCAYISFGLESMSPIVLNSMRKKIAPATTERILADTYRIGIGIQGNFIFGETAETAITGAETLAWWQHHREYQIALTPIQHYPGTRIYEDAIAKGAICDRAEFIRAGCPNINGTSMDDGEFGRLMTRVALYQELMVYPAQLLHVERKPARDLIRGPLYAITCLCPHCGSQNHYGSLPVDRLPFGRRFFRLACRSCRQRLDITQSIPPVDDPGWIGGALDLARKCLCGRRIRTVPRACIVRGSCRAGSSWAVRPLGRSDAGPGIRPQCSGVRASGLAGKARRRQLLPIVR